MKGGYKEFPCRYQIVFELRLNESLGDKNLVNIIEDWGVLEEYAGEKLGFFQLLENDGMTEIRVLTGRVGFKREFKSREDPLYNKIMDFCRRNRFLRVSQTARDEQFFK